MKCSRSSKVLVGLMLLVSAAFAQKSSSAELGDYYYRQFNFKRAVFHYQKALKHHKEDVYLLQHLGDAYRLLNDWASAETYYAELQKLGEATPVNKLYYAEALREAKKYDQAKNYYAAYLQAMPDDSSARERLRGIETINDLSKDRGLYHINNLSGINSSFSEFGVTMHGADDIYFSSNRKPDVFVRRVDSWTNGSFNELYKAEVKDTIGTIKNAMLLQSSTVNKKFHEASPCFNEKLNELYFDRSNYNGRRTFPSVDKTVKLKIYKVGWLPDTKKWDGELKEAVPFNNKEYSVCHPSLNAGGDTLYFTSDMPGGYGRADIYMATRQGVGQWGTPVNLGPGINSSGDDMFPFIAADGTLYFASNGHTGLGGLDVFESKFNHGVWSAPKNLGAPINTNADDFGLVVKVDNKHGYFCSNRPGGSGDDDIYSFEKRAIEVNGITYNGYTGKTIEGAAVAIKSGEMAVADVSTDTSGAFTFSAEPNNDYTLHATKEGYHPATKSVHIAETPELIRVPMYPIGDIKLEVTVIDKKTRQPLDSALIKITNLYLSKEQYCYTDKDGKCTFVLDTNTNYLIEASKATKDLNEKYLNVSTQISTKGIYPPTLLKQLMELDKVKIGVAIRLENIYYDLDKWFIRPDAAIELDRLVKILKDNPTIEIELSSHTDCRASASYNMTLSKKRAQAAVEYIASQGITLKRMVAAGYGESKLMNKCRCEGKVKVPCTEEEHQFNRRTEFKVTKF